jgi:hypothetical protein
VRCLFGVSLDLGLHEIPKFSVDDPLVNALPDDRLLLRHTFPVLALNDLVALEPGEPSLPGFS